MKETGWEGVGFVHVAQDKDQWLAYVNTCCVKGGLSLGQACEQGVPPP